MNTNPELKPCPWCPDAPITNANGDVVRCKSHTRWMTIDAWNRRAPISHGTWNKGPSNGGAGSAGPCSEQYPGGLWGDGDALLVAVEVTNNETGEEWLEYHAVRISCDSESFSVFSLNEDEDCGWPPESWSWWMRLPSFPSDEEATDSRRAPLTEQPVAQEGETPAVLHNPDNLTSEQYGASECWRLLTKEEIYAGHSVVEIEVWSGKHEAWAPWCIGNEPTYTYRTRLTVAELAALRSQR